MIDELQLGTLINKCKHLKYKFAGVYASDIVSFNIKNGNFVLVQSDTATHMRTHCLLLCNRNKKYLFADPLGLPLNKYSHIRDRLFFADLGVTEIIQAPLQNLNSNLCERICIYIAHCVFDADFPITPCITEQNLMRFVKPLIYCCLV